MQKTFCIFSEILVAESQNLLLQEFKSEQYVFDSLGWGGSVICKVIRSIVSYSIVDIIGVYGKR